MFKYHGEISCRSSGPKLELIAKTQALNIITPNLSYHKKMLMDFFIKKKNYVVVRHIFDDVKSVCYLVLCNCVIQLCFLFFLKLAALKNSNLNSKLVLCFSI